MQMKKTTFFNFMNCRKLLESKRKPEPYGSNAYFIQAIFFDEMKSQNEIKHTTKSKY